VTADDDCDGPVPVICQAGNITGTTCNWTQTFTYWAVDLCGNNISANVTYTWEDPECCLCWGDETAWGYNATYSQANLDIADSNNWGWTNGPLSEGSSYVLDLYAGAGQNDISKGEVVGTVSVNYTGICVNVTYSVDLDDYYLGETHLWVGLDPLPEGKRTAYTDVPGQFPYGVDYGFNSSDPDTWETEWSWYGCDADFSGEVIYVAAHAVVHMPVECEEENTYSVTQTQTPSDDQTTYLWSASSWWTQWTQRWSWWN
jgi:hypothetical protein